MTVLGRICIAGVIGSLSCASRSDVEIAVRGSCSPEEGYYSLAHELESRDEAWRRVWLRFARQGWPSADAWCGIASLSVVGDVRVVPSLSRALRAPRTSPQTLAALVDAAYDLTAHGSAKSSPALLPLLDALASLFPHPPVNEAAYAVVGQIDLPAARLLLHDELRSADLDRRGFALGALGAQGDAGAVATGRSFAGDSAWQAPHRLESVSLFFLTVSLDTIPEGLLLLDRLDRQVQARIGRRAAHAVCERARRQPSEIQRLQPHRVKLEAELDNRQLPWRQQPARASAACAT